MKNLLLIFFTLIYSNLFSNHFYSGELSYEYLGNNNYRISLIFYRDCSTIGASFDDTVNVTVYDSGNNFIENLSLTPSGGNTIPQTVNFDSITSYSCFLANEDTCLQYIKYEIEHELTPVSGGYSLIYQRCCLVNSIINVQDTEIYGLTNSCQIPGLNSGAYQNNSPIFNNHSPFTVCAGESVSFDHSAYDADADSLHYEIITANTGGSNFDPIPIPALSPPFISYNWSNGYSITNPLGLNSICTINSSTGELNITANIIGRFLISINVSEYRNGVLISQKQRNLQLKVVNPSLNIKESNELERLEVIPNPIDNYFSIKGIEEIKSLILLDFNGKIINQYSNINLVDVSNLDSGIYFLRIQSENKFLTKKVVIK